MSKTWVNKELAKEFWNSLNEEQKEDIQVQFAYAFDDYIEREGQTYTFELFLNDLDREFIADFEEITGYTGVFGALEFVPVDHEKENIYKNFILEWTNDEDIGIIEELPSGQKQLIWLRDNYFDIYYGNTYKDLLLESISEQITSNIKSQYLNMKEALENDDVPKEILDLLEEVEGNLFEEQVDDEPDLSL